MFVFVVVTSLEKVNGHNYKSVETLRMKIRDDNLPILVVIKTLFHRDQLSTIVFTAVTK